jgi:NAD(P)-dependent dehydrogenase (short-subunit alcohol dehydrogenase family)
MMSTSNPGPRLQNKVAIVTGAGRGIGAAIARRYAREGAKVVIAELDPTTGADVAAEITTNGGAAICVPTDVSRSEDVNALVASTLSQFGRVDVLVNNAGVVDAAVRHVLEADEAWWDLVVDTNLKGHFLCSLAVAKHMATAGGGTIITMSSGGATRSHRGMVAYDASKGGIEALTRALALDLAPYGIRVVGLVPGLIMRERETSDPAAKAKADATVPLGRAGTPDDLAGPAVFLATEDASYIHGSMVVVDGGVLFQQRSPQAETFPVERFPTIATLSP